MRSTKKASGRKPKKTTKTVVTEVILPHATSQARRPKRRPGPRAFQQPNPKRATNPSPTIRRTGRGDVASIPGSDLVATISVPEEKKFSAGDILVDVRLNPVLMALPRLLALSKLYKRFRIVSMVFEYEPTATIQPGSLLGIVDYDPFDDPTIGTPLQRLQRARATYGEKGVNITNKGSWSVVPMKESLFINSDLVGNSHWSEYARFVIYANSDIAVGTACGSVTVRYSVEFSHPSYETPGASLYGIQGYSWFDTYSGSEEKITASQVDTASDLTGVTVTTPSSGFSATIVMPYDSADDELNWYIVSACVGPHINVQWGLVGSPVGCTWTWGGKAEGSATGDSTMFGFLHITASVNHVALGTGLLTVDGGATWNIFRCKHMSYFIDKPRFDEKKIQTKEVPEQKEEKKIISYPPSQSSSSASSGVSKSLTSPTPANSPSVSVGWFRV